MLIATYNKYRQSIDFLLMDVNFSHGIIRTLLGHVEFELTLIQTSHVNKLIARMIGLRRDYAIVA